DFGVLKGSSKKEFADYHQPLDAFFYILYYLHDEGKDISDILESKDWKLFLLEEDEINTTLSEGSRRGYIDYETAGDITNIKLKFENLRDYVNEIT
ncbi:MAG: hypothetical protein ABEK36_04130, partial [Candidatus Aenigmatarchaeota archaeon]